jgi:hypothetical protein
MNVNFRNLLTISLVTALGGLPFGFDKAPYPTFPKGEAVRTEKRKIQ